MVLKEKDRYAQRKKTARMVLKEKDRHTGGLFGCSDCCSAEDFGAAGYLPISQP